MQASALGPFRLAGILAQVQIGLVPHAFFLGSLVTDFGVLADKEVDGDVEGVGVLADFSGYGRGEVFEEVVGLRGAPLRV